MPATAREPAATIRKANEDDAESIADLSQTLGYAASTEKIRDRLRAVRALENDLIVVATDSSGAVVGWMQAHAAHVIESGFRVEITGLVVAPEARRRGVGRMLVSRAEDWAQKLGAQVIVVRSNVQRVESHAFYPALGYQLAKTQKVYRKNL